MDARPDAYFTIPHAAESSHSFAAQFRKCLYILLIFHEATPYCNSVAASVQSGELMRHCHQDIDATGKGELGLDI
jgi:hypothetical protein